MWQCAARPSHLSDTARTAVQLVLAVVFVTAVVAGGFLIGMAAGFIAIGVAALALFLVVVFA